MAERKLIIQVRVNEGTPRDVSPHIPYSPEEIADQAIECWRQGASVVHYHARDPQTGAASTEVDLYADVVRRIKQESDLITFPTLGASALATAEERVARTSSKWRKTLRPSPTAFQWTCSPPIWTGTTRSARSSAPTSASI
jgi:uncharacterized protein (DUF849 family)